MLQRSTWVVYSILGLAYVLLGFAAILGSAGWLPQEVVDDFLRGETVTPLMGHIFQEFGASYVALGSIFFWHANRRESNLGLHWIVTFYFFLIALVHWVRPDGITDSWRSGTFNSIPFVVTLILGVVQLSFNRRLELRQQSVDHMGTDR